MKESRYNIWVKHEGVSYVYNGVSGALLRVSPEDLDLVKRIVDKEENSNSHLEFVSDLRKARILVDDDLDEIAFLANRYNRDRFSSEHLNLTLVTSLGCNFNCPYCFEAKHPSIMSEGVQRALLGYVDDKLSGIKSLNVCWFGGEPLVAREAVIALSNAFIERCDRANLSYSARMTTNGYLLDEATSRRLRECRIRDVQICLDGPPQVHDRMRPLANGKGTFATIFANLQAAVKYLNVTVRINTDYTNIENVNELLAMLADAGFAGKLKVAFGQIVAVSDGVGSPSSSYNRKVCINNRNFARLELELNALAMRYGLSSVSVPGPVATPCTAVRKSNLVVGSEGELYKCWESVGNKAEIIGSIFDYENTNGRLQKWLKYDPFSNSECKTCIALPVCMGGCAHHALDVMQYENRCSTFRHTYEERILAFVKSAEQPESAEQKTL